MRIDTHAKIRLALAATLFAAAAALADDDGGNETITASYDWYTSCTNGGGGNCDSYTISTVADLLGFANLVNGSAEISGETVSADNFHDKTVKLADDTDLDLQSGVSDGGEKVEWTPIGNAENPFKGTFDGNGQNIKNLYISGSDTYAGLFGYVLDGTVKSLGLEGGSVSGGANTGGVAGYVENGTIEECYTTCNINSTNGIAGVGGVVGYIQSGKVQNCYATGAVSGHSNVGGVVGYIQSGKVQNCYATGAVSGYSNVGGVVGYNYSNYYSSYDANVTNCAALNPSVTLTSGSLYINRVVGYNNYNNRVVGSIAFLGMEIQTSADEYGVTLKTAAELKTVDAWEAFSSPPWKYEVGKLPGFGVAVDMPVHIKDFFEGEGTEEEPYQIIELSDLEKFAELVNNRDRYGGYYNNKHYKLAGDIDMSSKYRSEAGYQSWVPIGYQYSFAGVFDGNYKKITGLYVSGNVQYAGLFGYVSGGTVKNLGVEGGSVTNNYNSSYNVYVGGVAGYVDNNGTVENCYATASVSGSENYYTDIYSGGVVGYLNIGSITNCYAAGSVVSTNNNYPNYSYAGGIAGYVSSGNVTNCAALNPSVMASGYFGRVAGGKDNVGTLSGNIAFAWMLTDGAASGVDGEDRLAAALATAAGFPISWELGEAGSIWEYAEGSLPGFGAAVTMPDHIADPATHFSGGFGTEKYPYLIAAPADLRQLADYVNVENALYNDKHYKMTADIDLSDYGKGAASFNGGKGWIPIGKNESPAFMGVFDGGGKVISGLYINDAGENGLSHAGLFGYVKNGAVKNLGIAGGSVTAYAGVGSVAGFVDHSSVTNCYSTAAVSGGSYIGGVVGILKGGTVQYCYSVGAVSGENVGIGGVVGTINDPYVLNSIVRDCYSAGVISGGEQVGGVVGYIRVASSVRNCYAAGAVSGEGAVGGVVGFIEDVSSVVVSYCAALNPSVTASGFFGRVVGKNDYPNTVNNSNAFIGIEISTNTAESGVTLRSAGELKSAAAWTAFISPWVYEADKLPGLGAAVAMPGHIKDFFVGAGTTAEPYQISTVSDLEKLAALVNAEYSAPAYKGKNYKLMGDLDLSSGYGAGEDKKSWTPIGSGNTYPFSGVFDGGGFKIKGLYIDSTRSLQYAGLFGYVSGGTVRNLGIEGGSVTASYTGIGELSVGGIAGYVNLGKVQDCYVTASVSASKTGLNSGSVYAGGAVGYLYGGTVTNCYAAGAAVSSTIQTIQSNNSYAHAGGVAGFVSAQFSSPAVITNCAALNLSVTATPVNNNSGGVGRVIGRYSVSEYITNTGNIAFSDMESGTASFTGTEELDGTGRSAGELKLAAGFPDAFKADPWTYEAGSLPGLGGGTVAMPGHIIEIFSGGGAEDNPYQIASMTDLEKLAELVNAGKSAYSGKYYKLMDNIDLSSGYGAGEGKNSWIPIGSGEAYAFKGVFDGNGKKITGLYINSTSLRYAGLFGCVSGGTVKNLGIDGGSVTASNNIAVVHAGGLAGGITDKAVVTNCYVTAAVAAHNSEFNSEAGGVVGLVTDSSSVSNCYAAGAVAAEVFGTLNAYAGGVAGYLRESRIENCAALNPSVTGFPSGRVTGYVTNSNVPGNIAFAGMNISGIGKDSLDGEDRTAAELKNSEGFPTALVKDPWTHEAGKLPGFGAALPMPGHIKDFFDGEGTGGNPYKIASLEDLEKLAGLVNGGRAYNRKSYIMTADIDISAVYGEGEDKKSWTPIGSGNTYPFSGVFDGGGNKIKGLYINNTNLQYAGLFGYVGGGTLKNIGIEGGSVTAAYQSAVVNVGGLAGLVFNGTVNDCYVTASVAAGSASASYNSNAGGVLGLLAENGSVTNCYAAGAVAAAAGSVHLSFAGGVIGYAVNKGNEVTNCAALNPSVTGRFTGRVAGWYDVNILPVSGFGNIAFSGMLTGKGTLDDMLDGEGKTAAELKSGEGFPDAFKADPWTYAVGKLPGLGGAAAGMPEHIKSVALILKYEKGLGGNILRTDTLSVSRVSPNVGDTLSAALFGGGSLDYVWRFGNEDGVEIGRGNRYIVKTDDIGGALALCFEEAGERYSVRTAKVAKAPMPPPPDAPVVEDTTHSTVKLLETAGYEYSYSRNYGAAGTWQKSPVFSGLSSNTNYYFYQRVAETKSAYASAASQYTQIRTHSQPDQSVVYRSSASDAVPEPAPAVGFTARPETPANVQLGKAQTPKLPAEFTAGPNPVSRNAGAVKFYRQGGQVTACELAIYDAVGNNINRVKISDMPIDGNSRRQVGYWDLTDRSGRQVSAGTYLVKGVLKTLDGKKEKVSLILGVR